MLKVILTGKIVSYKCCLPNLDINLMKDLTQMFFLTDVFSNFQVLCLTFIDYEQNVNKRDIS